VTYWNLNTVRCEALFASTLQGSEHADRARVQAAIMAAVRAFGSRGCAARVAQEFGDHPDTAIPRMYWVREVISRLYGTDEMRAVRRPHRSPSMSLRRHEPTDEAREIGAVATAVRPA
jgi:hypothetical protein